MSDTPTVKLMTSDDLFALRPSKKIDRWLFRGELRESKVTKRNPSHSGATATLAALLVVWLRTQPKPRGKVYSETKRTSAFAKIPRRTSESMWRSGTAEQAATTKKKASFVEGPPIFAVEVLSPNDKQQDIDEAIEEYLDCGTEQVWIVDPYAETVTVHRARCRTLYVYPLADSPGGDDLPGFSCLRRRNLRVTAMPAPFPVASLRDFYAFEQHVKTCRAHRGLDMVPQWYQVPVFYFSNPVASSATAIRSGHRRAARPSTTSWSWPA